MGAAAGKGAVKGDRAVEVDLIATARRAQEAVAAVNSIAGDGAAGEVQAIRHIAVFDDKSAAGVIEIARNIGFGKIGGTMYVGDVSRQTSTEHVHLAVVPEGADNRQCWLRGRAPED